jgi:hypothetical protein
VRKKQKRNGLSFRVFRLYGGNVMDYDDPLDTAYKEFTSRVWSYHKELMDELATVKSERTMLIVINVILLGVIVWLI